MNENEGSLNFQSKINKDLAVTPIFKILMYLYTSKQWLWYCFPLAFLPYEIAFVMVNSVAN